MPEYDEADSALENFSSVLLFSQQLCENFHRHGLLQSERPSDLMYQTRLQIDPSMCRIVYSGWLMGTPVEGIVLAAACAMERDVFRSPSRFSSVNGNPTKFAHDSRNSLFLREYFDCGYLSEPIALRNLLFSCMIARYDLQDHPGFHMFLRYDRAAIFSAEFETFRCLCETIADRFQSFLEEDLFIGKNEDVGLFCHIGPWHGRRPCDGNPTP